MLLTCAVGTCADDGRREQQSLAWAERLLREVPAMPTRDHTEFDPSFEAGEAGDAFDAVIHKYGESARAECGLAACYERMGDYARARDLCAKAMALAPSDGEARKGWEGASRLASVADAIAKQLPKGHAVRQLRAVRSATGEWLWACLSMKPSDSDGNRFGDIRLALFQQANEGCRRIWQSSKIMDPRLDEDDFSDAEFYVVNMDADRMPEIVVYTFMAGCNWCPSHLNVYRWRRDGLEKTVGLSSDFALWINDRNRDGRCEVGIVYAIGDTLLECEKALWTDIYTYKRGTFRKANRDFPEFYCSVPSRSRESIPGLREILGVHPDDWDIWMHLGESYEILGHPKSARRAYKQASKYCEAELAGETDKQWRAEDRKLLADLHRRIVVLTK